MVPYWGVKMAVKLVLLLDDMTVGLKAVSKVEKLAV